MFQDIRNCDSMPTAQEGESMESEAMPAFVKFVVIFTIAMTVANVVLMKVVALGG